MGIGDAMLGGLNRRDFMGWMVASGAGLAMLDKLKAQEVKPGEDLINVAIVGVGRQGKILLDLALKIPGLKFKAVCDIWSYSQKIGVGLCRQAGHEVKVYEDYKEMISSEKDLHAVIVATPDCWHAQITNDCLKAGLHVYCEKEMANTLEAAKSMVLTARQTGKLLQIGHQRRSNPYYQHALHLMTKDKFCGTVTTIYGQWHQLKNLRPLPAKLLERFTIPQKTLEKWGFGTMSEFYEWRWFKKYAGGPMTDLGSHQLDVFNWFLDATPVSVSAVGGMDFALQEAKTQQVAFTPESLDHTIATYEWNTAQGPVRGVYQVNLTTSYGGFYEVFMGTGGSMVTSEIKTKASMFKEQTAAASAWENEAEKFDQGGDKVYHFDPLKSRKAQGKMDAQALAIQAAMDKPAHQPHLENFFSSIRGKDKLTCTPEIGYETAVAVLKANEAATTGQKLTFGPGDFKV